MRFLRFLEDHALVIVVILLIGLISLGIGGGAYDYAKRRALRAQGVNDRFAVVYSQGENTFDSGPHMTIYKDIVTGQQYLVIWGQGITPLEP